MKLLKFDRKTFNERFGTKKACYQHLADLKWSNGYACKRCEGTRSIKGKQPCSRRCGQCGYDESVTAGSLFHKLKFDIDRAFGMLYEISTSKKGANSVWLAERFGVQQNTAWLFRQKVQVAMESSGNHPLEGEVHVDEFEIGTPKKGEQGRSHSDSKMRVVIAIEHRKGQSGRGYAKVIKDYSSESLKPIFDEHIDKEAFVLTDGWSGYKPIKEEFSNLVQILSDKGKTLRCFTFKYVTSRIGLGVYTHTVEKNTCKNISMNTFSGSTGETTGHPFWIKLLKSVSVILLSPKQH